MKRVTFALAIGGGLILISWVTSPAARTPAARPTLSPAEVEREQQSVQATTPLTDEINAQAARLHARLSAPPPKPDPARNPFAFKGTYPFSTEIHRKGTDPVSAKPVEKGYVPLPSLVAITADAGDGGLMRTAVLAMNDEMKIVRPGQRFERFLVEAVGPDSVRIVDTASPTRATFTIAIR